MVTKRLYMHWEYDWAVFLAILLYIHTAFVFSAIGVAWIELIRTLDISYTLLGLISVVGAGLSLVSMLVGGSLISRYGSPKHCSLPSRSSHSHIVPSHSPPRRLYSSEPILGGELDLAPFL